jgi:2'-5' RNA ligase
MKRIFIAVKIVPGVTLLKMISTFKVGLANESVKWTNPENIHITLAFLGDTDERQIIQICSMLKDKCKGSGEFDLLIKGTGIFRNLGDPRVIWTGIEPSVNLIDLYNLIKSGLNEEGFRLEDRPFNPHLTLGRIKYLKDKEFLKMLLDRYQFTEIQKVPVNEVILYESILLPSGPVYKPLSKIGL